MKYIKLLPIILATTFASPEAMAISQRAVDLDKQRAIARNAEATKAAADAAVKAAADAQKAQAAAAAKAAADAQKAQAAAAAKAAADAQKAQAAAAAKAAAKAAKELRATNLLARLGIHDDKRTKKNFGKYQHRNYWSAAYDFAGNLEALQKATKQDLKQWKRTNTPAGRRAIVEAVAAR